MKIAILTESGVVPLTSGELADEVIKRVGVLSTRGAIRKAIEDVEREMRSLSTTLGPQHL